MSRQLLFATVIISAFVTCASAQTNTGMTGPRAGTGTGKPGQAGQGGTVNEGGMSGPGFGFADLVKGVDTDVMVRGCLARADGTQPGAGHGFVLTKVRAAAPSSETSVREAVGTSGTAPVALSGKDDDLQKLVGQRVELRGRWDKSRKGVPTNGVPFKVISVKGVEGSCLPPAW